MPASAIVAGVVRDTDGNPIPEVRVNLEEDHGARARSRDDGDPERTPLDALPDRWKIAPEGAFQSDVTDADGRFRISGAIPWSRHLRVRARHERYLRVEVLLAEIGGPRDVAWVELILPPDKNADRGTILGELFLNGSAWGGLNGTLAWHGPTDKGEGEIEDGEYWIPGVEPGEVTLSVALKGIPGPYTGNDVVVAVTGGRVRQDLKLGLPAFPISGRVLFRDGDTVPDAVVWASCPLAEGDRGELYWDRLNFRTSSASDGTYSLNVPDIGRPYRVSAELAHGQVQADGIAPGSTNVDFVLRRPGTLEYRIVDAVTGEPVEDIDELRWRSSIEREFRDTTYGLWTRPDPDGWRHLELPNGSIDVRVNPDEPYAPTVVEGIYIRPGEVTRVTLELTPGMTVLFKLAEGVPPPPDPRHGASIFFLEEENWESVYRVESINSWNGGALGSSLFQRSLYFDEEGQAEVGGLTPGRFRFKVVPPDFAVEPKEVVIEEGRTEPVILSWR